MDNASAFSQVLRFLEEGLADLVSNIPAFRRGRSPELRLRTGRPLSAVFGAESLFLSVRGELTEHAAGAYICTGAELQDTFYKLCRNSVYAYEQELKEGFVTIPGGHRCGFAGRTVVQDGAVTGLRRSRRSISASRARSWAVRTGFCPTYTTAAGSDRA